MPRTTIDGIFSRADFICDEERDLYICPGANPLKTTGELHSDNTYRYIARKYDCDAGVLKPKCCPNTPARRVQHNPLTVTNQAVAVVQGRAQGSLALAARGSTLCCTPVFERTTELTSWANFAMPPELIGPGFGQF